MGTRMNREAYEQMIAENLAWLLKQPRTLERDHIEQIVRRSADHEYGANNVQRSEKKPSPEWYKAPPYWRPRGHVYVTFSSKFIDGIYTTIGGQRYVLDMPVLPPDPNK